ncbi:MAG: hypothetical protein JSS62_01600 [Verrucomicrobia bacterium]|nr:hypothetical protein [Verrucomicrobiota bacterium]MBS0646982.1 hypothetical protein [Verrucomicrobiota bacterium]
MLGLGSRAIGPVFFNQNCPLAEHLTYSPHVARLTSIHLPDIHKSFRCFWDRGPAFSNTLGEMRIASYHPSKDISPIVDYCFVTTSPFPAAISFRYHSGPVSFLGVHPELAEWCLNEGYSLSSDDLKLNHYLFERSCQLAGLSS